MNRSELKVLYDLEEKMQLVEAEIIRVEANLLELKKTFEGDRKDIWTFINTLTKGLREGQPLKRKYERNTK